MISSSALPALHPSSPSPSPLLPHAPPPPPPVPRLPHFGNPFRSTFPLGNNGSSFISIILPGTMYSGNLFLIPSLISPHFPPSSPFPPFPPPPPHPTYPTSSFPPPSSSSSPSSTTTTARSTPACSSSTPSISPNSIRYPLTFSCWSCRPRNSRL